MSGKSPLAQKCSVRFLSSGCSLQLQDRRYNTEGLLLTVCSSVLFPRSFSKDSALRNYLKQESSCGKVLRRLLVMCVLGIEKG